MAAYKVSKKDIQHVSTEAQQCECENRCIDCFKLQSELNEVRLEFPSVKEIVTYSTETWPQSTRAYITNMYMNHLILPHSVLTTSLRDIPQKKSYCEVTAYKPYTVTNNRFQLLDNLQEDDSSGFSE
jgi:hypothetical protein